MLTYTNVFTIAQHGAVNAFGWRALKAAIADDVGTKTVTLLDAYDDSPDGNCSEMGSFVAVVREEKAVSIGAIRMLDNSDTAALLVVIAWMDNPNAL